MVKINEEKYHSRKTDAQRRKEEKKNNNLGVI